MTAPYRLYGAETSPYSQKLRSYLIYKGAPFEWRERTHDRVEEFARYAKLPLAPVLVDADDEVMQDSTPTMEALERAHAEPSATPDDPALAFIAALLEDYADEWLNKAMVHYRWSYPEDQDAAARRTARGLYEDAEPPEGVIESIRTRMAARLHHIGSTADTAPVLEGALESALEVLERCLASRPYLLGQRPSFADFAIAAQLAQLLADPTPAALIRARAPNVVAWVARMERPEALAGFASLDDVHDDVAALLREAGRGYLPWMAENARAVADDAMTAAVEIDGRRFAQKPQRYAAKGFAELQRKYAGVADHEALAALLREAGCDALMQSPDVEAGEPEEGGDDEE